MIKKTSRKLSHTSVKNFFSFLFVVIGFIAGFFIAVGSSILLSAFLSISIFSNAPWPLWGHSLLAMVFVIIYILVIWMCFRLGVSYHHKLEHSKSLEECQKILINWIILTVILLFLFMGFLFIQAQQSMGSLPSASINKENYDLLIQQSKDIQELKVTPTDEGFYIRVEIDGPSEGTFLLNTHVKADGYVKADLLDFSDEVKLVLNKQGFNINVLFNELAAVYREKLRRYLPVLEKRFGIDEQLLIEAELRLIEAEGFTREEIRAMNLSASQASAYAKIFFSCLKESCKVVIQE